METNVTVKIVGNSGTTRFASFLTDNERNEVLRKIGAKLKFLTVQNFGYTGSNRPSQWAPLSEKYAKRVKRSVATMDLTGKLMRSLRVSAPDGNSITVSSDTPYDEAQQNGNSRLPARPFFPINHDGSATPYAQRVLETTAKLAIQEQMRRLS